MKEEQAILNVRVHPGAKKTAITGYSDGILHVKITARPEKGKANESLIKYLGDRLDIAKSRIEIQKGTTSRNKRIKISGIDASYAVSLLLDSAECK